MQVDREAQLSWQRDEAARLIGWALGSVHPDSGFGRRGADGVLGVDQGRPLWVNARMVHCLALGHLLGDQRCTGPLDLALRRVPELFRDRVHGGWFADADRPGTGPKEAYGHAFMVLAASSATVAGRLGAQDLLEEALAVVADRFWDEDAQMPLDSYDVTFGTLEPYRGANAAMHLVEAFLAAGDATGDGRWPRMAAAVTARIAGFAEQHDWRLPEHYDARWVPELDYNEDRPRDPFRPYGCTPGHGLEWSRLVLTLEAGLERPPAWIRPAAIGLARRAISDGWDRDIGGFVYTTDKHGVPVVAERFHWVVCEAIGAAWALHQATGDDDWSQWQQVFWQFARSHLVDDAVPGGWRHELAADNGPQARTWTDRPDVYHALQATLWDDLPLAPGLARALADRAEQP